MDCVTVSPKFQIVIPVNVRECLKIRAGDKMQVIQFDGRIELVLVKPVKSMRGFLQGIDPLIGRDKKDRI